MKKVYLLSLSVAIILSAGFFAVQVGTAEAEDVVISNIQVTTTANTAAITWQTNVQTESKVLYWSDRWPEQINETGLTDYSTNHETTINFGSRKDRDYSFYVYARDENGAVTQSDTNSFTLSDWPTPIVNTFDSYGVTNRAVAVWWDVNFGGDHFRSEDIIVEYGESSGNYTGTAGSKSLTRALGNTIVENLYSNSTYYARLKVIPGDGDTSNIVYSDEVSFTTKGEAPQITEVIPAEGTYGDQITIRGNYFGTRERYGYNGGFAGGYVSFGEYICPRGCVCYGQHNNEIVSWSETEIVVTIGSSPDDSAFSCGPQTGPLRIASTYYEGMSYGLPLIGIEGPIFTVTGDNGDDDDDEDDGGDSGYVSDPGTTTGATTVTSKYGCNYSTTTSNEQTIKVSQLFPEGGNVDNYLGDVYDAYMNSWNRAPRCDELEFHLSHSTPLDRLQTWLEEEVVTEKWGCNISITTSNTSTLKVAEEFGGGAETDVYLESVYEAYQASWNRVPCCDELQFHLDHATPIERLKAWLEDNKPGAAIVPVTVPVVDTIAVGQKSLQVEDEATFSFAEDDTITFTGTTSPNSIVKITITSDPIIGITTSDSEGNWSYTVEEKLARGNHIIQVAVVDQELNTTVESDPIEFTIVKAAKATTTTETFEETGFTTTTWIIVIAAVVIVVVLIVIISKKKTPSVESKQ